MVPRIVKLIESEIRMVVTKGWGEGDMESYCLIGREFQFCKMKSSVDGW